ncbi:MAG: hypothetical protein Q8S54_04560 [Bacteroidota bacterium]|nr:hypothetical protein [Odoribacter sp.]MDP3642445.1 hypothetical protein [Bacteroidota bacterium]
MKKEKSDNPHLLGHESNNDGDNLPGYPIYPESEDIYSIYLEEKDINPEDISKTKVQTENYNYGTTNEYDFDNDFSGGDLDIPGSELDDEMENIGSEDEENNYYSLGGDDHEDLEEDQGD